MSAFAFPDDVVTAICGHMNADHGADSLLIVRAQGAAPGASSAEMVGMDGDGADFVAQIDGAATAVRVPWSQPLTERAQVRPEIVRMYQEACAILGVPARDPGAH